MAEERMKTTWTTRRWMKLIDEWMGEQHHATMPWKDVLRMEGGYGGTKIKSVADAMKPENEGTWPNIWFRSHQTDFSVYRRHDYVYSLLFGRMISKGTISVVGQYLANRADKPVRLNDWGGTIFTAIDMLELLPVGSRINMVNLRSPQMDFAAWIIEKFALSESIHLLAEDHPYSDGYHYDLIAGPVLLSETLEHCLEPFGYLLNPVLIMMYGLEIFTANSFCTPAYGHFIPVIIDGKSYATTRTANKAFREKMEGIGFVGTKLPGWNSRAWKWTR